MSNVCCSIHSTSFGCFKRRKWNRIQILLLHLLQFSYLFNSALNWKNEIRLATRAPAKAPAEQEIGHFCHDRSQSRGIGNAPAQAPKTAPKKLMNWRFYKTFFPNTDATLRLNELTAFSQVRLKSFSRLGHYTRLKKLSRDKHSSLLRRSTLTPKKKRSLIGFDTNCRASGSENLSWSWSVRRTWTWSQTF